MKLDVNEAIEEVLNELLAADPHGVQQLLALRSLVNEDLGNHPDGQVT